MPTIDSTWLCIENHPTDGLRISNLPGGPTHCYFTGTTHLADCGYVDLDAARRVANPDLEAFHKALYEWYHSERPMSVEVEKELLDVALGITETTE